NASVALLRTAATSDETIWENEFFNRSVDAVYYHDVDRTPDPLPEKPLTRSTRVQYALAEDAAGKVVARDPQLGMTLYRVNGLLVVPTHVSGIYANDTWSGSHVAYTRRPCSGGTLAVTLGSDPALFSKPQLVLAGG